jgi:hypothetical protein
MARKIITMINNPLYKPFPPELSDPATAWPYLRHRFPEYFEGVGKMPGETDKPVVIAANYQTEQDTIKVARYFLRALKLADISEALTGRRLYAGSNLVKRLQAVQSTLNNTTTTPEIVLQDDFSVEVAA